MKVHEKTDGNIGITVSCLVNKMRKRATPPDLRKGNWEVEVIVLLGGNDKYGVPNRGAWTDKPSGTLGQSKV